MRSAYWLPMCEAAMSCLFKLADTPMPLAESILARLMDKMPPFKLMLLNSSALPPVPVSVSVSVSLSTATEETNLNSNQNGPSSLVNSDLLARFFNLVGLVATRLLIYLNQNVVCELKRRKMFKENVDNSSMNSKTARTEKAAKEKRRSMKLKNQLRKSIAGHNADSLEEEMGMQGGGGGAEAEDVEVMFVESLLELKVTRLGSSSLIAHLLPACVQVLRDSAKYACEQLQLACAMCLIRIMILSQTLCAEHLQLIFTLMKRAANPAVRSHLILGIGDLVYRFPNALEPWTSHLYLPLRDTKSTEVRMNTIRVLSHLILKEMIKTRGQMYEIALCTIDENAQIQALAKLFFSELAQRNNGLIIYNAMPDIISQLSGGGATTAINSKDSNDSNDQLGARLIAEDHFRTIVTYLFTFIKKDKQCETLIEKLCQAFRQASSSERKCRDLAFCLSKITLSENGIKKLKETFKFYADKLTIPMVYDTFKQTILKNARKLPNLKNETKLLIDELEKQIDEVKQKGLTDEAPLPTNQHARSQSNEKSNENEENMDQMPSAAQVAASTANNRQQRAATKATSRNGSRSSARNVPASVVSKQAEKSGGSKVKRRVLVESSSSSSEEELEDDDDHENDSE